MAGTSAAEQAEQTTALLPMILTGVLVDKHRRIVGFHLVLRHTSQQRRFDDGRA